MYRYKIIEVKTMFYITCYDTKQRLGIKKGIKKNKNNIRLYTNIAKTKKQIILLVNNNFTNNHNFITLTYSRNELQYERAIRDLQMFCANYERKPREGEVIICRFDTYGQSKNKTEGLGIFTLFVIAILAISLLMSYGIMDLQKQLKYIKKML